MEDVIDWLRGRPTYEGQIAATRTVPGGEGVHADLDLEPRLAAALADRGVERPYRHQAEAIEAVRDGDDVVLATPTASGKSLAYTVPAFERAMDHGGRTLYLGPQNALINDQVATLDGLARDLGFGSRVTVDRYTGQLDDAERRAVRDRMPTVLATTPDMLHYGILPHAHRLWEWFVRGLELVVVDEVHEYRGVFGSHVALLFRRLARICERFDAAPTFVCCSATVANPREHAAAVTGRPAEGFALVDRDDSPGGPTHWVLWNPPVLGGAAAGTDGGGQPGGGAGAGTGGAEQPGTAAGAATGRTARRRSYHVETMRLVADLVSRGHQTVAFTGARQTAERYAAETADLLRERGQFDLADRVAAYQAALRTDTREAIEARLHDGDLRGVWSTSALELGVDVGGLDAVVLDGYPGTRMAARQRAGRAGRGEEPSLVVMVAGEDQLDQYLVADPPALFDEPPERAVVNPENDQLLPAHVRSAARENWLSRDDERHFGAAFPEVVADLTAAGDLERRETDRGVRWTDAGGGSPQHETSLRSISDRSVDLFDRSRGERLGSLSLSDALRDAHPGAVYHHRGRSYEVVDLDLDRDRAELDPARVDYYTRVLTEKTIDVVADREERALPNDDAVLRFADVELRERVTGFERRARRTGEALGREPVDLPETTLRTRGLYFTVPRAVEVEIRERARAGVGAGASADGGESSDGGNTVDGEARTDDGEPADGGDARPAADPDRAFAGGIHAAEHALISLFPLAVLCDRRDVGGLSTPLHPHTGRSTVFIYDGHPGGVGLAREGYRQLEGLAGRARRLIADCDCAAGCPACVQSPQCGNANDPLDTAAAVAVLDGIRDDLEVTG